MASNPYVNKVVFGSATLVDLTGTTATADKILEGYGAFGADGAWMDGTATGSGSGAVWQDAQGYVHLSDEGDIELQTKTVSPTESAQTVLADAGYYALDRVNVNAIPSNYVGSGVTQRTSSDLTASGATVTAPSGYYSSSATKTVASGSATPASSISATGATVSTGTNTLTLSKSVSNMPTVSAGYISSGTAGNSSVSLTASINTRSSSDLTVSGATVTAPGGYYSSSASKSVASGTAGTPTATKGAVSNHAITVTPSVTNTTGYITGSTKTGTGVSVSASELVSGTYSVTSSGTKDVTNYASASVPSGTEGTPTATKGTVSNHSVSVTPSVTNSGGYITGSTKTGTAVTVSASELVSGNLPITQNGTNINVANYATVSVDVSGGASNIVQGTFTVPSTAGTFTVNIPYNGNGYPLLICTYPTDGYLDGYVGEEVHQYGVANQTLTKRDANTPCTYNSGIEDNDYYTVVTLYKSSSTNPISLTASRSLSYQSANINQPSDSLVDSLHITSKNTMSLYGNISGGYGYMATVEYMYVIVYSE